MKASATQGMRGALFGAMLVLAGGAVVHADSQAGDADAKAAEETAAILALDPDRDFGAYLAGDCATCHRRSAGEGIPPIAGLPSEHLVRALVEYRIGLRDNEVMVVRAARLADEEIAALAAHFAAQAQ